MSGVLEEKEAIRELFSRYCTYTDRGNPEGLIGLFAEDGAWEATPNEQLPEAPCGRFQGAVLREFLRAAAVRPGTRHMSANEIITVDGNDATATSYAILMSVADGKAVLYPSCYYEDKLVKIGGHWLFKERIVKWE